MKNRTENNVLIFGKPDEVFNNLHKNEVDILKNDIFTGILSKGDKKNNKQIRSLLIQAGRNKQLSLNKEHIERLVAVSAMLEQRGNPEYEIHIQSFINFFENFNGKNISKDQEEEQNGKIHDILNGDFDPSD